MTENSYFRRDSFNAATALSEAAALVEMLNAFVAVSSDLAGFERNSLNHSMDGLNVLLDLIQNGIEAAADELGGRAAELDRRERAEAAAKAELDDRSERGRQFLEDVFRTATAKKAAREAAEPDAAVAMDQVDTYPRIPAREAAIRATFEQGYDVKQIARAVMSKQSSVRRVLQRLAAAGELDEGAAARLERIA